MRVVFAGTPDFAAQALASLLAAGFEVPLVLTQPDRPAGRGMQLQPSAVKRVALAHGIPVAQPVSLKLDGKHPDQARAAHELLRATPHDVMVVVAYGLILPHSVLGIPPLGCVNIHASLLPRWRGAAPIQRAIEAGDPETGVTLMQMDAGLDTGPMLAVERLPIALDDTAATLHDKLAALGARMIVATLPELARGAIVPVPQPEAGANYAAKILKGEAALDFALPAQTLARRVMAFNPFPGAAALVGGEQIKIWRAEPVDAPTVGDAGEVLAANAQDGVLVACGEGVLRLLELQKPGGKRLPAREFIKGFALETRRFS
ncbi:MAG: methionyl-tRNA formyltransferase [Burkholderiaceae bacterium]|nr:methionyl-tRNA formyltransferase [Burkholderiaceae bacterium]